MNKRPRQLRQTQTKAEQKLWQKLRNRQLDNAKFRRQHPIKPYVVDFFCQEAKLIVEIDGGHHAEQINQDQERTKFLESKGYKILRFWNNEVLNNIEGVLQTISENLKNQFPSP